MIVFACITVTVNNVETYLVMLIFHDAFNFALLPYIGHATCGSAVWQ